jgi:hypothetical protein
LAIKLTTVALLTLIEDSVPVLLHPTTLPGPRVAAGVGVHGPALAGDDSATTTATIELVARKRLRSAEPAAGPRNFKSAFIQPAHARW